MKMSAEILNELKTISPLLAGIEKKNVFSVPETTYSVPSGYFDSLSENILNKIKHIESSASDELHSISPMLLAIQHENVFISPPGYFEELPAEVIMKIKPQDAALIRMKKRSSVWQYARAAVVTGVIALSALMVYNNQSPYVNMNPGLQTGQFNSEQQINDGISKLSDEEIIKYLEISGNATDAETLSNNLDEKQLPENPDLLNNENKDPQERANETSPKN